MCKGYMQVKWPTKNLVGRACYKGSAWSTYREDIQVFSIL
jgi:hypothetical protein